MSGRKGPLKRDAKACVICAPAEAYPIPDGVCVDCERYAKLTPKQLRRLLDR